VLGSSSVVFCQEVTLLLLRLRPAEAMLNCTVLVLLVLGSNAPSPSSFQLHTDQKPPSCASLSTILVSRSAFVIFSGTHSFDHTTDSIYSNPVSLSNPQQDTPCTLRSHFDTHRSHLNHGYTGTQERGTLGNTCKLPAGQKSCENSPGQRSHRA